MSKSKKSFFKNSVALAMLAGVMTTGQAFAQNQTTEEEAEEEEAIVVTGSRIRSEFNSASPIQVITTDSAVLAGVTDTGDLVQSSSLAAGSPQIDATISSAFVTDGGPGAQTISLRGLGANRTLVLLNGRRAGPAGTRGAVSAFDLNVLPVSMIDRVEILKDGASSIYGSDAVAGVVNIITRDDLDGGSASLRYSLPEEDGGSEIAGDITWGRTFDRGFFNVSADYYMQEETLAGQRDYTNCSTDRTWSVASGLRNDVVDLRTNQFACRGNTRTGLVWLYDYAYFYGEGTLQRGFGANFIQPDPSGQIGVLNPGSIMPTPANGFQVGAPANWYQVDYDRPSLGLSNTNSPFEQNSSIVPEIERMTLFANAGFDITPRVEAYAEVLLNRRETAANGFRQVWTYLYSSDFDFASGFAGGDPFSAGWTGLNTLSPTVTTDHADASQRVDYMRAVAGVRGDFDGWLSNVNWDIFVQHSLSDAEYTNDRILQDAVYSSDGRTDSGSFGLIRPNSIPRPTASCVGYNTPISDRPCVDVDWMSSNLLLGGGFTPEEEAFLYDVETGTTEYTQTYVEASIGTDLFAMPAGNVAGVLGAVMRRDELIDTPGHVTLAGNAWGSSASGITRGDDTTTEVFGEIAIPIFRGTEIGDVETSISGRYTDVESFGEESTYKVGVTWRPNSEFLVRYTQGTSFRAPALFELYLNGETSFPRQSAVDPCINWQDNLDDGNISQRIADNCAADGIPGNHTGTGSSATAFRSGGAGLLDAETSEARVLGVVWTPSFANLSVALDYFEIDVENEVATLGAGAVVFGCYNSESFPTDPLCSLFTRVGGGGANQYLIDTVNNSFLNINSQNNRGLDLTAQYGHEFSFGDLTLQAQATWQFEDVLELFDGTGQDLNGRVGDPDFVGNLDAQFEHGDWTFFWRTQFIGSSSDIDNVSQTNIAGTTRYDIEAEFITYHSASISRDFDRWGVVLGVANLTNQEPPTVSTVGAAEQSYLGNSVLASQYDYVGRRLFLRLTRDF